MIFPFLWMVSNTFNTEENIFRIPPVLIPDLLFKDGMFTNYIKVLGEFNFLRYTANSLFIAFSTAFGQVFTCSIAGFAFAKMEFRGKNLVFTLLFLTMMVPIQVTIIPEFYLMVQLNWIDTYLPLIVPSLLVGSFGTLMYRSFFEAMPKDLEEASVIAGAGPFVMFFKVYFPLTTAPSVTLFIIAFMNNWNDLLRPLLYASSNKDLMTVTIALTEFQSEYDARWNYLLTGAVLSIVPLLILYFSLQRYVVAGIARSGIKG